jgi:hypothetical protein
VSYTYGPDAAITDIHDRSIVPLLRKFVEGYNVTVMMFGASGLHRQQQGQQQGQQQQQEQYLEDEDGEQQQQHHHHKRTQPHQDLRQQQQMQLQPQKLIPDQQLC